MSKLVLIRHGKSKWNALNLFNGWVDTKLSDEGTGQAEKGGKLLKGKNIPFDQAYTSVLTRAIQTLHIVLEEIGQLWIPEEKSWRLNERHYGALQGLNKKSSAEKWGAEQVHTWRRSYDVLPPLQKKIQKSITVDGVTYPALDRRYDKLDPKTLPLGENLQVTLKRVIPFWEDKIAPDLRSGKNIIIAAHGNSLRALTKYIENISDEDIINLEIATGQPIVYDFDYDLNVINKEFLS